MAKRVKKDGTECADKTTYIALTNKRFLCRDSLQMWIAKKKVANGNERYERIGGYYTTFESLLEGYVREQEKKITGDDVVEVLNNFVAVEKDLRSIARKLGRELDDKQQG